MKKRQMLPCAAVLMMLVGCASNSYQSAREQGWNHYGDSVWMTGNEVSLGAIDGSERNIVVSGIIADVCEKKGCWMNVIDDQGNDVFVKFKEYKFFVPRNAEGHRVTMHGWTEKQLVSVAELQHYAMDAGKSEAEIAAITEPSERVTFFADSVYIEGDGLDEPHSQ